MRSTRGSLTEPGQDSPYRGQSVDENLHLFQRMRNGEFAGGEHVLRLKIDMASPNINMRDPVIYRSVMWPINAPAMPGVFIQCMTSPIVSAMP